MTALKPTSIRLDPGLWQRVKVAAVVKNITIQDYVTEALNNKLQEDK